MQSIRKKHKVGTVLRGVLIPLLLLLAVAAPISWGANSHSDSIRVNDEAVKALNLLGYNTLHPRGSKKNLTASDWQKIFDKFKVALEIDPHHTLARDNLAIAHNNFALYLMLHEHKNDEALKQFHEALFLQPVNRWTSENMNVLIRKLGKNPKSFMDRVTFAEDAKSGDDLHGAVVEYRAALKLDNQRAIHKRLGDIYRLLDDKNAAVAEYAAAYRD